MEKGKARKYIEERTGTNISVYGHTVSIIGKHYGVLPAKEAIEALITGARHSTAYKKMEKALSMMKTIEVMEKMAESRDKGLREI
jgi:ribosomal RNA assembly protein